MSLIQIQSNEDHNSENHFFLESRKKKVMKIHI